MKKISITVRIPVFFDIDLNIKNDDYEELLKEWDNSNFGIVMEIVGKYVDLNSIDIGEAQERFGETEIVDIRDFGEGAKDELEINTIIPKEGKLN